MDCGLVWVGPGWCCVVGVAVLIEFCSEEADPFGSAALIDSLISVEGLRTPPRSTANQSNN